MRYSFYDVLKHRLSMIFMSKTEPTWKQYLITRYHFILNLLRLPYDALFVWNKIEKQIEEDPYAVEEIRRIFHD